MPDKIDQIELDHWNDIKAWRVTVSTQIETLRSQLQTAEQELHDAAVVERSHLAFLTRKYGVGTQVFPDGSLKYPDVPRPVAIEDHSQTEPTKIEIASNAEVIEAHNNTPVEIPNEPVNDIAEQHES